MIAAYDEMASGQGTIRPHWRDLMGMVWGMTPDQLAERQARARAHFAETEAFMDIYGREDRRPQWSFDLLPLILPEPEWRVIAAGLVQRARLLDLVLADLYGPQRLLAEKRVPPYLVFANPEFLRPACGVVPAQGAPFLHFYAADLVRMPDGLWRVFNDRTQAAAGVGYALRNRRVLARTFPEAFRTAPIRRLSAFLDLWQGSLGRIGATLHDDPRAVLLTPGPYNDAYFEHVYLAGELGLTLAQGSDLTVRDGGVYLKTLEGLLRVDVIYRRLDGAYCDPLELNEESALGVAGLLQAARAGAVVILNLPGSAAIETPAFAPFLPGLARHLLGEELALPAVTTWWCGQREPLEAVKADLGRYVLRPTFAADPAPVDPAVLGDAGSAELLQALQARPEAFTAMERVAHGVVPALGPEGIAPEPIMLRVAAIWHDGTWAVMPGGVARIVGGDGLYRSTLRNGGVAKDVWVLSEEESASSVPVIRTRSPAVRRDGGVLRSRTADDLFWLGRYVERADGGGRVLRAALERMAGGGLGPRDIAEIALLAQILFRTGWIAAAVAGAPAGGAMSNRGITAAASGPVMRDGLASLRRLAVSARDRVSLDMWRALNHVLAVGHAQLAYDGDVDSLLDGLDELVRAISTFAGFVSENMNRGPDWHFLDMGRRVERGLGIGQVATGLLSAPPGQIELALTLLLEITDSTIAHRARYPVEPRPASALDLVLGDPANPRGLAFQLVRLRDHLAALAKEAGAAPALHAAGELAERVTRFPFARIEGERDVDVSPVLGLLEVVAQRLPGLSDSIARSFFTHTQAAKPVGFTTRPPREAVAA
ncbi:MAG: circularly permuted type 2 ATP-grasp protein [Rhodospirillaceae bacterium]|nr:circularly permuted type 2 ATP-grasp protein [Rhodospirillaceae bacterium]